MSRAVSPVLGVVLMAALAVVLAGVAGVVAVGITPGSSPQPPVDLSAEANATSGRIDLVHESGPTIDVREVEVRIAVDDELLRYQPPVPFRGARGFLGAPSGPFNAATEPRWELGEEVSFRLAGTNQPGITAGSTVRIELYRDELPIARAETIAR